MSLILVSCGTDNKDYTYFKNILKERPLSKGIVERDLNGNVKYMIDTILNEMRGNRFAFYDNQYLKAYAFSGEANPIYYQDTTHCSYIEQFDSLTHKIISIQGKPIVYKAYDISKQTDSINIMYLLTDFSYYDLKLQIADSNAVFKDINLSYVTHTKFIQQAKYDVCARENKKFFLIARFSAKLKYNDSLVTYYDTFFLRRVSRRGLCG